MLIISFNLFTGHQCLSFLLSMNRSKRDSTKASSKATASQGKRKPAAGNTTRPGKRPRSDAPFEDHQEQFGISAEQHERLSESVASKVIDKLVALGIVTPGTSDPVTLPAGPTNAAGPNTQNTRQHVPEILSSPPIMPQAQGAEVAEQVVQALTYGESEQFPHSLAHSSSTPLAYQVSDKLREKIKSDKYVDFRHLLPGSKDQSLTLKVDGGHGDPAIHLASSSPNKPLQSIEQWLTAFTNFQFIYIQAHPHSAADLLKYGDTVRDLNQRCGFQAASFYDENFRYLREQVPSLQFGNTHTELWVKAATPHGSMFNSHNFRPKTGRTPQDPRASKGGAQAPRGFCFAYNSAATICNARPCKYKHSCQQCQGTHPQFKCPSAASPINPTRGPNRAPSTSSSATHPSKP